MTVPAPSRIYDLGVLFLAAVVKYWPEDLPPLPARQFLTVGLPAWDDPLLAVAVERTFGIEADAGAEVFITEPGLYMMRGVTISVTLGRMIHDVDSDGTNVRLPSPAQLTDDARIVLTDAQALFNCLLEAHQAGELGSCNGMGFDSWQAQTPSGGMAGGVLRVRAMLL